MSKNTHHQKNLLCQFFLLFSQISVVWKCMCTKNLLFSKQELSWSLSQDNNIPGSQLKFQKTSRFGKQLFEKYKHVSGFWLETANDFFLHNFFYKSCLLQNIFIEVYRLICSRLGSSIIKKSFDSKFPIARLVKDYLWQTKSASWCEKNFKTHAMWLLHWTGEEIRWNSFLENHVNAYK